MKIDLFRKFEQNFIITFKFLLLHGFFRCIEELLAEQFVPVK